jgi:hypothetical protein
MGVMKTKEILVVESSSFNTRAGLVFCAKLGLTLLSMQFYIGGPHSILP